MSQLHLRRSAAQVQGSAFALFDSSVKHEWLLLDAGVTITPPFDEEAVKDSLLVDQDVDAGASATVVFTAPTKPGEHEVVCGVAGHIEAGMAAKLIVQ